MTIRSQFCGEEYDVTLFEYGNTINCECGHVVKAELREIEEEKIRELKRLADRIAFLITCTDYPEIDIEIEKEKFKERLLRLFPDKTHLYELIYEPRFMRLKEQFREDY